MKDKIKEKKEKRKLRHKRLRVLIKGTAERPRLNVFRSSKHIWVQLIDDQKGHTLLAASDLEIEKNKQKLSAEIEKEIESLKAKEKKAFLVGQLIAQKAKKAGIEKVVFDRGGWKYHGRIKALAEGARKGGLKF